MDENQTIDVYYDMDIAQICQHFNKTRNTVDKAVAKLVKDYPDKDYKYKNPDTLYYTYYLEGLYYDDKCLNRYELEELQSKQKVLKNYRLILEKKRMKFQPLKWNFDMKMKN